MLRVFASRQIRNRATLGGNLVTASPDRRQRAGAAHARRGASCWPRRAGERTVPLADFFTGYRKTVLRPGEIIREIVLPRGGPGAADAAGGFSEGVQAARARHQHRGRRVLRGLDAAGVVRRARLAYGGVAVMPCARAGRGGARGKKLSEAAATVAGPLRASSSRSTTCAAARSTGAGWS
jgi:xanthine dehydrogenase large subunit